MIVYSNHLLKMQYGCNKSQKLFIEQAIKADIRLDGRKNT